jgi:hypothetical protein
MIIDDKESISPSMMALLHTYPDTIAIIDPDQNKTLREKILHIRDHGSSSFSPEGISKKAKSKFSPEGTNLISIKESYSFCYYFLIL